MIIFLFRITFNEVQVYFKENQFLINKKTERFGFIDFISNCGGLMGLFMGISLLSIAEILHYFVYFLWELGCTFFRQDNRVYDLKHWIWVIRLEFWYFFANFQLFYSPMFIFSAFFLGEKKAIVRTLSVRLSQLLVFREMADRDDLWLDRKLMVQGSELR